MPPIVRDKKEDKKEKKEKDKEKKEKKGGKKKEYYRLSVISVIVTKRGLLGSGRLYKTSGTIK